MATRVQKWGNSQGLRIPKQILEETNLHVGDDVTISVQDGNIVISPSKDKRRKYDINELVSRIPPDYKPQELDWGKPVGREVW